MLTDAEHIIQSHYEQDADLLTAVRRRFPEAFTVCRHCGQRDDIQTVTVAADLSHTGEAYQRPFGIDACLAPIVAALNAAGLTTRQSCCGHGETTGRIDLADGRALLVLPKCEPGATQEPAAWDYACPECDQDVVLADRSGTVGICGHCGWIGGIAALPTEDTTNAP